MRAVPPVFSPCRRYRYRLEDTIDQLGGFGRGTVAWLMLNPSTADENKNDPTIDRCIDFTERWGYTRWVVGNLFAWRETKSAKLAKITEDLVGPDNDRHLVEIATSADLVMCAWGAHKLAPPRAQHVTAMLIERGVQLHCLRFTPKAGAPEHPLYLPKSLVPFRWDGAYAPHVDTPSAIA